MGVYLDSSNIDPVEDPSTNSIGGGRRALKASRSLAGLSWISSPGLSGENEDAGWRGAASMIRTAVTVVPNSILRRGVADLEPKSPSTNSGWRV